MNYKLDWSVYKGNLAWLQQRTIYVSLYGSHAYGTNTSESDIDIRGVFVAPKEYYFGFLNSIEQVAQNEPDFTLFELKKFVRLACDSNPNVLEILFTNEEDHLYVSDFGQTLLDNKNLFLSKRIRYTFGGYASSQLKRIQNHYAWMKDPPKAPPERKEFDLPDRSLISKEQLDAANADIQKKLDIWNTNFLDDLDHSQRIEVINKMQEYLSEIHVSMNENLWIGAARSIGYDENFIHLLDKERRFLAQQRYWNSYQEWKKNRNPKRAKLEAKFGYDTKHGMHLVRLYRSCREVLTTGELKVKRYDAKELLEIRHGAMTYEDLIEFAQKEDKELDQLMKESKLPNKPKLNEIEKMMIEMVQKSLES